MWSLMSSFVGTWVEETITIKLAYLTHWEGVKNNEDHQFKENT